MLPGLGDRDRVVSLAAPCRARCGTPPGSLASVLALRVAGSFGAELEGCAVSRARVKGGGKGEFGLERRVAASNFTCLRVGPCQNEGALPEDPGHGFQTPSASVHVQPWWPAACGGVHRAGRLG